MAEEENVYSSAVKYEGYVKFSDLYKFCYDWLNDETGITAKETKYEEKLKGDTKEIKVEWVGDKKLTDYFQFKMKINFVIRNLKKVTVKVNGVDVDTNSGNYEIKAKGALSKDWQGKFEMTAYYKFLRSIYEKYIIPQAIEQFRDKITGDCDEFLQQVKAYMDIEGKRLK